MTTDRLVLVPSGRPERGLANGLTWRAAAFARTLRAVWRRAVIRPLHVLADACLLSADLASLDDETLGDLGLRREPPRPDRLG